MTKVLLVFSGGLDSMLAAKVLQMQGLEVKLVSFESPFYGASKAKAGATQLGLPLLVEDFGEAVLALVKNPPNGLGKYMNPCIDCHAAMFRRAREIAERDDIEIIASGEVLGQRPFSQTSTALRRVAKAAGTEVLRPLSAKLLVETKWERSGLVDRNRLLAIDGRSRSVQQELANEYGLKSYPSPAGGCLLTERDYSVRLREMLSAWPQADTNDISLLRAGRVFWRDNTFSERSLLVIGRTEAENNLLLTLARPGDILMSLPLDTPGPTALLRGFHFSDTASELLIETPDTLEEAQKKFNEAESDEILAAIARLTAGYAPKLRGSKVRIISKRVKSS